MRRGMDETRRQQSSGVTEFHTLRMAPLSSSWVLGRSFDILLFVSPHKFSIGLRSGEFSGQGGTSMLWSSSHLTVDLAL